VAFDDGVAKEGMSEPYSAENVCPSTSCPKEGMSESYMTIHSYSQLMIVRFKNHDLPSF